MRRIHVAAKAAFVVTLFALTGCGSNNEGRLEGTKWTSFAQTVDGKELPAGKMTLEFRTDGRFIAYGGKGGLEQFTGTYALGFGDFVTLTFDEPLRGTSSHVETVRIRGIELEMSDWDGTTIRLRQVPGRFVTPGSPLK